MSVEEKEGRHARSVRLTTSVNDRLIALCDHLGVTPNSYLVGVIGKAVATDEMAFLAKTNQSDMVKILEGFVSSASNEIVDNKEIQLTLDQDS